MPDLLDRDTFGALQVGGDERLARVELRRQIGRLERELAGLRVEAFPRLSLDTDVPASFREPRIAGLGELEQVRDALAERIAEARKALRRQSELETANRELLQRVLAAPAEHKWIRVSREDLGLPGCGHWHSRPRLGLLGMLMGWWRVRVSSGCPLSARLAAVERQTGDRGAAASPLGQLSAG